ncbi:MAG: hypothetical protein WD011_04445 [Nitriliruptoraceae bacterium]
MIGHAARMRDIPDPEELRTAARACTVLAYAAGLAGIGAGTLVLRDGDLVVAIIVWVITFAVGAALMGVALVLRATTGITARLAQLSANVAVLVGDRYRDASPREHDDPWEGHAPY